MAMFGMSIKTTTVLTLFRLKWTYLQEAWDISERQLIVLIYGRLDLDNLMSQSQT